jgi:hypothetical protein
LAWSSPKTWASGYVVLAADLNNIRDQLNATAPATLTTQGDIVIASGANALARLAKSTTSTQYLANTGTSNAPAWNEVALDTGVSGTLPVGNGGTGQTSLTTGAILIGNATSGVTMVTQTTKGQILVGDGSGPPQMLGVGSNTQVLIADSGETTGVKWGTNTFPDLATQAETEAATDGTKVASVELMHYHPGVAKVWVKWEMTGSHSIQASYNMTSVTDGGNVGETDHLWNVDFSGDATMNIVTAAHYTTSRLMICTPNSDTMVAGGCTTWTGSASAGLQDAEASLTAFGDQ